jgi:23S rRNA pseudouridine2605 synthase
LRINRYIARSGVASRRKAEDLINSGVVYLNGNKVTDFAVNVRVPEDVVKINNKIIKLPQHFYYALNKPAGYTTTKKDKHAKKTIFELLPDESSLFSVGRLDRETEGLILITNNGDFAQNVTHPTKKIEKEYEVETKRPLTAKQISEIQNGVELKDGIVRALNVKKISDTKMVLIIEEGRNRIVRRTVSQVGNEVDKLKRTRIGDIELDIETGKYRKLTDKEVANYV